MLEAKGDFWTYPANWRVFTTNGIVINGYNVMGRGIALEVKKNFPDVPLKLGSYIRRWGNRPYFLKEEGLISFPTKEHWKNNSSIQLIMSSAKKLVDIVDKYKLDKILMVRPGCGEGNLDWNFVKTYVENIFDNRFTVINRN